MTRITHATGSRRGRLAAPLLIVGVLGATACTPAYHSVRAVPAALVVGEKTHVDGGYVCEVDNVTLGQGKAYAVVLKPNSSANHDFKSDTGWILLNLQVNRGDQHRVGVLNVSKGVPFSRLQLETVPASKSATITPLTSCQVTLTATDAEGRPQ